MAPRGSKFKLPAFFREIQYLKQSRKTDLYSIARDQAPNRLTLVLRFEKGLERISPGV